MKYRFESWDVLEPEDTFPKNYKNPARANTLTG
jgi:hypothetical protein